MLGLIRSRCFETSDPSGFQWLLVHKNPPRNPLLCSAAGRGRRSCREAHGSPGFPGSSRCPSAYQGFRGPFPSSSSLGRPPKPAQSGAHPTHPAQPAPLAPGTLGSSDLGDPQRSWVGRLQGGEGCSGRWPGAFGLRAVAPQQLGSARGPPGP